MADIIITCPGCGNSVTISEFVSAEFLVCAKCKGQIPVPARPGVTPAGSKLKLNAEKPARPSDPDTTNTPIPTREYKQGDRRASTTQNFFPDPRRRARRRGPSTFALKTGPWLAFIVLALIFAWPRYWPGAIPTSQQELLIQGGILALVFLHLTIVAYGFTDDAFTGVLCLIIPGYSLYYLFTVADQYLLRALTAALLISFGWDTALGLRSTWQAFYKGASSWIADTDSFKRK